MKKIKKVWEENKILLVLAIILIVCLIIFGVVAITYFYGSSDDVYGNRLDVIKDVPLNSDFINDLGDKIKNMESINNVNINVKGRIVYISINFDDATKIEDAKKIVDDIPNLFNDDELAVYDIEFTIKTKDYTLMGARNSSGSGIVVWNNYNVEESTEE